MTKADKTRQHILEKTAPLFNRKGFHGTSLAELTAATGLTKGALYGNFQDKEQMALEAFQYSIAKVREVVKQELSGSSTCKEQLIALLSFYSNYVFSPPIPGGCPLLNTAIEVDDHRTSMRRVVVKELHHTIGFIQNLIDQGIEKQAGSPNSAKSRHSRTWAVPSGPMKIAHSRLLSQRAVHIDRLRYSWT